MQMTPSALRASPPNTKEEIGIIIGSSQSVFGGEPIVSRDVESSEGVGETRLTTGSMYTDKFFTGQRQMTGLGIYHYQSWFYSPKLGRFLSADTIVPNPFNPQDFNRFAYVRNNPVRYIDPSGHVCSDPEDPTPTCDNSFLSTTKVGNKVVKGTGLDAGKPKVKKQSQVASGNKAGGLLGGGTPATDPNLPTGDPSVGGHTTPSLDPTQEGCPSWSVCFNDAQGDALSDFWNDNNDIMSLLDGVPVIGTASGLGVTLLARLTARQVLTANSIALIAGYFGLALLDPLPIEEVIAGVGIGLGLASIGIYFYTTDLQKINDAVAQTGALNNGGSIVANWDGAVVSGPNGTAVADTSIPFVAPASLALWGVLSPGIGISTSP